MKILRDTDTFEVIESWTTTDDIPGISATGVVYSDHTDDSTTEVIDVPHETAASLYEKAIASLINKFGDAAIGASPAHIYYHDDGTIIADLPTPQATPSSTAPVAQTLGAMAEYLQGTGKRLDDPLTVGDAVKMYERALEAEAENTP